MIMQKKYKPFLLISLSSILLLFAACSLDQPTEPTGFSGDGNNAGGDSSSSRVGSIVLTATQGASSYQFIIEAKVYNGIGVLMSGVSVNFTTTEGEFQNGGASASRVTGSNGTCIVVLETYGIATVTARAGGVSSSITVNYNNSPPSASLAVHPATSGPQQTITLSLDASASMDTDGEIVDYTFDAFGPADVGIAGLGSSSTPVISVVLTGTNRIGITITFMVTVRDNAGATATDTATFQTVEVN